MAFDGPLDLDFDALAPAALRHLRHGDPPLNWEDSGTSWLADAANFMSRAGQWIRTSPFTWANEFGDRRRQRREWFMTTRYDRTLGNLTPFGLRLP